MNKERSIILALIIIAAAVSRLLPHPPNVAPITAIALFAGAQFERKWMAFAVPFAAMLLSDAVLGFHNTLWAVYLAFGLIVCIGFTLKNHIKAAPVATATIGSSILFFIVTNLGVWLSGTMYPLTPRGFTECFVAAAPFFTHTALGDVLYSALLFGGFTLAERKFGWLAVRTKSEYA